MADDGNSSIGVGILGFAHGHVGMYCTRWRDQPAMGVRLVGGWDHDAQRLGKAAATWGVHGYASVDDLLQDPDVQAVVIGAETSYHARLVEKAAAAGKTIVVQKPLALTLPEADRIVDAVQKNGVRFTLAWQMRCDPQNMKIKEVMESGLLGKIVMVRRRHGLAVHTWANWKDLWHLKPELNRDIWADDASHAIDFIHWLVGTPETVTAEMETLLDPHMQMDNGIAVFRYLGGPLAEVTCSFTCTAAENTTEVIGERGSIIQNYGDVPSCNVPRQADSVGLKWFVAETGQWTYSDIASPAGHGARIAGLAGPLAEFLQNKRGPIATAEDGRMSLRMTLACYVSSREGRRVRIDDEAVALV